MSETPMQCAFPGCDSETKRLPLLGQSNYCDRHQPSARSHEEAMIETPTDIIRALAPNPAPSDISLRDHIAIAVLPACIRLASDQTNTSAPLSELFARAAVCSYFAADALLIAREQDKENQK